jgi:hypothetical protein
MPNMPTFNNMNGGIAMNMFDSKRQAEALRREREALDERTANHMRDGSNEDGDEGVQDNQGEE